MLRERRGQVQAQRLDHTLFMSKAATQCKAMIALTGRGQQAQRHGINRGGQNCEKLRERARAFAALTLPRRTGLVISSRFIFFLR